MKLSEICIKRPVFTVVLSLVLIILGIMGYTELTLRALPKEFRPSIYIQTNYPGASPELVEQSITHELETALSSTPSLDAMKSLSLRGRSSISLKFKDISESAFLNIQSEVTKRVSSITRNLPPGIDPPEIFSGGGDDAEQLIILAIVDPTKTAVELGDYVQNNIVKPLQRLHGVAEVNSWSNTPAIRISLNSEKLKQYSLSANDLKIAIENNNQSINTGSLITSTQGFQINTNLKLASISQFEQLPIKTIQGTVIRLEDVAKVALATQNIQGGFFNLNGKAAVAISISAGDNANPIQLGASIHKTIANLAKFFPPGMHYVTVLDMAKPLKHSVDEVFYTVFEAIALVALITFLFLGNIRAAIIPMVTIPVCLISVFAIMLLLGYSINMITLLAIVLAVGLVVDDAIVVLENTHRHIEEGLKPFKAAVVAMKEIGFAIIGITISLAAVYLPTIFMHGRAAIYFREFAFTLAGAVIISGFIAITLSPMMCARVLKSHRLGPYENFIEHFFQNLSQRYHNVLSLIVRQQKWVLLGFILLIASGGYLFTHIPTNNMPPSSSNYIQAFIQTPATANVAFTEKAANKLAKKISALPSINNVLSLGGVAGFADTNSAFSFIDAKESLTNKMNQVVAKINQLIKNDPDISGAAFALNSNNSGGGNNQKGAYSFMVTGQMDYKPLSALMTRLAKNLKTYPSIQNASSELTFNSQEYNITINRLLASELGVNISDITSTLRAMLGGIQLSSNFEYQGLSYPIILQLPKDKLKSFANLQNIYVQSQHSGMLPISRFVIIKPSVTLTTRQHYNEMRAAEISFNLNPNHTLGQAMQAINQAAKTILPGGMQVIYTGEAKRLIEGNHSMVLIFLLGIVFIYLVLAALFESFIDPLIILFTVPLCIVGAIFALLLFGGSLNVLTGIGLVTLVGLVSKHGILITQFANQLQKEGLKVKDAAIKAATIRLRPILMTTATMVIGAMPLVLATGFGAVGRFQIGIVIVAGLIVGTFFSLIVVPIAYTLFAKLRKNKA